jgi:hypothetical protein
METNHKNRSVVQTDINDISGGGFTGQYAHLAYEDLFNDCVGSANRCTVDTVNDVVASCGGACSALGRDPVTGRYAYGGGFPEATRFVREVYLTDPGGNDFWEEYEIVVEVTYGMTETRSFELRHSVYDWRERY